MRARRTHIVAAIVVGIGLVPAAAALPVRTATVPRLTLVGTVAGAPDSVSLAGPVLAGSAVIWGSTGPGGSALVRSARAGKTRVLFTAAAPPPPPGNAEDPAYEVTVAQSIDLAASVSRVGLIRNGTLVKTPRCRRYGCDGGPIVYEPYFAELWAGPPSGPFRRLSGSAPVAGGTCAATRPTSVDVAGSDVLYAERTDDCSHHLQSASVRLVTRSGRAQTLATSTGPLGPVALTRHFAAWAVGFPATSVVVERRVPRAPSYRLDTRTIAGDGTLAFDLADDGTAVVVVRRSSCSGLRLGWASARSPSFHGLDLAPGAVHVRIVGPRIVVSASRRACRSGGRLAVTNVRGTVTTLASFGETTWGSPFLERANFDSDGRRFALAVSRAGKRAGSTETALLVGRLP